MFTSKTGYTYPPDWKFKCLTLLASYQKFVVLWRWAVIVSVNLGHLPLHHCFMVNNLDLLRDTNIYCKLGNFLCQNFFARNPFGVYSFDVFASSLPCILIFNTNQSVHNSYWLQLLCKWSTKAVKSRNSGKYACLRINDPVTHCI